MVERDSNHDAPQTSEKRRCLQALAESNAGHDVLQAERERQSHHTLADTGSVSVSNLSLEAMQNRMLCRPDVSVIASNFSLKAMQKHNALQARRERHSLQVQGVCAEEDISYWARWHDFSTHWSNDSARCESRSLRASVAQARCSKGTTRLSTDLWNYRLHRQRPQSRKPALMLCNHLGA